MFKRVSAILAPALAAGSMALLWANTTLAATTVPSCSVSGGGASATATVNCNYQNVSANSAIIWLQSIVGILLAVAGTIVLIAIAKTAFQIMFANDREAPQAYGGLLRLAIGCVILFGAAFWLGVLHGLTPS